MALSGPSVVDAGSSPVDIWPKVVKIGPSLTKFGPNLADSGPSSVDAWSGSVDVGPKFPLRGGYFRSRAGRLMARDVLCGEDGADVHTPHRSGMAAIAQGFREARGSEQAAIRTSLRKSKEAIGTCSSACVVEKKVGVRRCNRKQLPRLHN